MPIIGNSYFTEDDIIGRRSDGRGYLIAPKGKRIPLAQAVALGLIDASPPRVPYEKKPAQAPQETGVPITGPQVLKPAQPNVTDSAKKLAQEYGVSLYEVAGTGAHGRITKYDVEAFIHDREAVDEEE